MRAHPAVRARFRLARLSTLMTSKDAAVSMRSEIELQRSGPEYECMQLWRERLQCCTSEGFGQPKLGAYFACLGIIMDRVMTDPSHAPASGSDQAKRLNT